MSGQEPVRRFYWSRICRLCPMFFISAFLVVVVALALTHFRLMVSPKDLASQILSWLAFTIPGTPDINGLKNTSLINGVFWTLIYEWKFYFALPFLLLFRERRAFVVLTALTGTSLWLLASDSPVWYFLYGTVAATLTKKAPFMRNPACSPLASVLALCCLALTYRTQSGAYNPIAPLLLFIPFFVVANGNTFFGVLTCRPARVLGLISYSIYLLHSMFLYLGFRLVAHTASVTRLSPPAFWLVVCAIGVVTLAFSTVTYCQIESRFAKRPVPEWLRG